MITEIHGWGRWPRAHTDLLRPETMAAAAAATPQMHRGITRGNGRSYGDAAIGIGQTLSMRAVDRVRAFDAATGRVTVEAGVLLSELIDAYLPRGWFPYVVPGTRWVTVGGAIASDVHGKNHHLDGGFGRHVLSMRLALPDGEVREITPASDAELWAATVGGQGLTGTILEATLQLRAVETGWIRQKTVIAPHLGAALRALDDADSATYSVAWIDCVATGASRGRSLVYVGEHARYDELPRAQAALPVPPMGGATRTVPIDFPSFALNRHSVAAFNELYYRKGIRQAGKAAGDEWVSLAPYFFPLDAINQWNRIYGARGFLQHQCVIPPDNAETVLHELLERITARGDASFLAVLKKLGPAEGMLSFPMPGYTLALDFAYKPGLLPFLDDLDRIVVAAGGRIYLAKDARQSLATFEAGYPRLAEFRALRQRIDPEARLQSRLASRLHL